MSFLRLPPESNPSLRHRALCDKVLRQNQTRHSIRNNDGCIPIVSPCGVRVDDGVTGQSRGS